MICLLYTSFLENLLDNWQVIDISIVNTRTVLGSNIIALLVFTKGIDDTEVM